MSYKATMLFVFFGLMSAIITIVLSIIAIKLKSRSVANLSLLMNIFVGVITQPWAYLLHPPPIDPEHRYYWMAAFLWAIFFSVSLFTLVFTVIGKPGNKSSGRRSKRRRRS